MSDDWTVENIQREHFAGWVGRRMWAIIDMPDGTFRVYCQTADGVAPSSDYPTLRRAMARLLQLARTGPVAPQTSPEIACIGRIEAVAAEIEECAKVADTWKANHPVAHAIAADIRARAAAPEGERT